MALLPRVATWIAYEKYKVTVKIYFFNTTTKASCKGNLDLVTDY